MFGLVIAGFEVILRLPSILITTIIGVGIFRLIKPVDETKAALIATLYLISPLNILNVAITTDTTLILFSFLSIAALFKALKQNHAGWYALAGAFFGLAFLSKYFAALLGFSYLVYFIFTAKSRKKTMGFALLFLTSLPFALINIYWNYTHCWDNILFNLYTRNEGAQFSISTVALFLGVQLYLFTPPLLWHLYKNHSGFWKNIKRDQFQIFLFVFAIPMAVFTLLSLKKVIGLHWVLAFYPALSLLLFQILPRDALQKMLKFMLAFSVVHLLAIAVLATLPMETSHNNR